jgi:hypothetical protein
LGWKSWAVGAKNEENDLIKSSAKYKKKIRKAKEKKAEKEAEKRAKRRAIMDANLKNN